MTEVVWDVHGPTPDPKWQRELDRLFPPGLNIQSLHIYWEPGYAWQPVERWMVGKLWPVGVLPPYVDKSWLEGPNPATLGYWDYKTDEWVSLAPPISRRQWRFYQKTGQFSEPFWVIQGDGRGHTYRMSRQEGVISKLHGGPSDTPAPGELPFATPDDRMFALLAQRDKVRLHVMGLNWVERAGEKLTEERAKAVDQMRQELWNWLSAQAGEWGEHVASQTTKEIWETAPVEPTPGYAERKLEQVEERFLSGA